MNEAAKRMMQNNNKLYQKDEFVTELYKAAGIIMQEIVDRLDDVERQIFFDTMTETGVKIIETYLGIHPQKGAELADRRQNVQANWLAGKGKKFTLQMIQEVAAAWENGDVNVDFVDGKILIEFKFIYGVPKYIDQLIATIEMIKPAHLGYGFVYKTHSWRDVKQHTWRFIKERTWAEVKEGNWGAVHRKT